MTIKAIETHWNGYRFRSRLEARWAVFFTALQMDWEYEPEGFETEYGWYLPDFFMMHNANRGPYVEIKAIDFTDKELAKLEEVCTSQGAWGMALWGAPGRHRWIEIHKECGAIKEGLSGSDAQTFLTALNPRFVTPDFEYAVHFGVRCARSARFEHGEAPVWS